MTDQYLGEIRIFGGNYAPLGWAFCNGQLLQISEYDALYSLLGTTYGGDGVNTFGLPDLRGRVPLHPGNGVLLGQMLGSETVTLTNATMATHTHFAAALNAVGVSADPQNEYWATASQGDTIYVDTPTAPATMNAQTLTMAGGSQPHGNIQPYMAVNFIIALAGIYPSQN